MLFCRECESILLQIIELDKLNDEVGIIVQFLTYSVSSMLCLSQFPGDSRNKNKM